MPRPKVVLFDLGKVLVDFDWSIAARRIAADAALSPEALYEFIRGSDVLALYERGHLSSAQFFDRIRTPIGYRNSLDAFRHAFSDIFSEISDMVRLHAEVRTAGLPTWIFSNTNDWAIAHIRSRFPFFSDFAGYFLSFELGVMKPEPGIYAIAEEVTGQRGGDILYIDDLTENTAAAEARGWQVVHHTGAASTLSRVRAILDE